MLKLNERHRDVETGPESGARTPIAFTPVECLVEGTDRHFDGSNWSTRWHELEVYRTARGGYVLRRIGRSQWQGETTRVTYETAPDLCALAKLLDATTPLDRAALEQLGLLDGVSREV